MEAAADPSLLAIFCIANLTVMYGAYRSLPSYMLGGRYGDEAEGQEFKTSTALLFVVCASVGLMLMFYLEEALSKVMLLGMSILSCLAVIFLVEPYLERCIPDQLIRKEFGVPTIGAVNCLTLIELPLGCGVVALWLLVRGSWQYAWVVNDVLGFSIAVLIIASVRVTNLKVATVLLVMVLLYDVFWVYISPLIFHEDVMLSVTDKLDLPVKIAVPFFRGSGTSIISLGDVVLPGLFSAFLLRFDRRRNDDADMYFVTFTVSYALGLALCLLALVLFNSVQPAMLYLSPCTLVMVYIQAACRKEIPMLWHGNPDYSVIDDANHVESIVL